MTLKIRPLHLNIYQMSLSTRFSYPELVTGVERLTEKGTRKTRNHQPIISEGQYVCGIYFRQSLLKLSPN